MISAPGGEALKPREIAPEVLSTLRSEIALADDLDSQFRETRIDLYNLRYNTNSGAQSVTVDQPDYENDFTVRATTAGFNVELSTYDGVKLGTYFVTVDAEGRIPAVKVSEGSITRTPDQLREYLHAAAQQVTPDDG